MFMNTRLHPSRRALATLELILALPILLFMMALIYDYGTIVAWRVREHSVARLAAWESRWPRNLPPESGFNATPTVSPPSYWPATASMAYSDQGNVAEMNDGRVDLPVVRGPLPPLTVNSELLDPTIGLREGSAGLSRKYALLGTMGDYSIQAQTWLIDDKWQYQRMGMWHNVQRRIPILYGLSLTPISVANAHGQSASATSQTKIEASGGR